MKAFTDSLHAWCGRFRKQRHSRAAGTGGQTELLDRRNTSATIHPAARAHSAMTQKDAPPAMCCSASPVRRNR